jgi:hypothetical protein
LISLSSRQICRASSRWPKCPNADARKARDKSVFGVSAIRSLKIATAVSYLPATKIGGPKGMPVRRLGWVETDRLFVERDRLGWFSCILVLLYKCTPWLEH